MPDAPEPATHSIPALPIEEHQDIKVGEIDADPQAPKVREYMLFMLVLVVSAAFGFMLYAAFEQGNSAALDMSKQGWQTLLVLLPAGAAFYYGAQISK